MMCYSRAYKYVCVSIYVRMQVRGYAGAMPTEATVPSDEMP